MWAGGGLGWMGRADGRPEWSTRTVAACMTRIDGSDGAVRGERARDGSVGGGVGGWMLVTRTGGGGAGPDGCDLAAGGAPTVSEANDSDANDSEASCRCDSEEWDDPEEWVARTRPA